MNDRLIIAALTMVDALEEIQVELFVFGKVADRVLDAQYELKRALLEMQIESLDEHGEVCVVESGRDCDGVEYSGRVTTIQATLTDFEDLRERIAEYADGPFHLEIVRPSEAESIEYVTRDTVMEAYENGHPHSISSRF